MTFPIRFNDPSHAADIAEINRVLDEDNQAGSPQMAHTAAHTHQAARRVKNFLLTNYLSLLWRSEFNCPVEVLPVAYVIGMVAFSISVVIRIGILAYTVIKLVYEFFDTLYKGERDELGDRMKFRGMVCLGASGELVSSMIGVICPPIAYKMDEWIQSNPTIHAWYAEHYLSLWLYEFAGNEVEPGGIGLGSSTPFGNDNRMVLKRERAGKNLKFFKTSRKELSRFMNSGEVATRSDNVLLKITELGFLYALQNGRDLETFKNEAIDMTAADERDAKEKSLDEHMRCFVKYLDTLSKDPSQRANLEQKSSPESENDISLFEYEGPQFTDKELATLILLELLLDRDPLMTKDADYFKNGIRGMEEIKKLLTQAYLVKDFQEMNKTDDNLSLIVDYYFDLIPLEDVFEELEKLRLPLRGRNPTNAEEFRIRNAALGLLNGKLQEIRSTIEENKSNAALYLARSRTLVMVNFEGEERPLRDVVRAMVSELKAFTNEFMHADREMTRIVTREAFPNSQE